VATEGPNHQPAERQHVSLDRPGYGLTVEADERPAQIVAPPRRRRRRWSTMTWRIFAPNLVALGVLVGGILYLDEYRDGLFEQKIEALQTEAQLIAAAVGESALAGPLENRHIDPYESANLVARMSRTSESRLRLFNQAGILIADSRDLAGANRRVQRRFLPPPDNDNWFLQTYDRFYDRLAPLFRRNRDYPVYQERWAQHARDYDEVAQALYGEAGGAIRSNPAGTLILTVAVPVFELRQVVGVLMLSADDREVTEAVREARGAVFQAFGLALAITALFSIFLAGTIERPLRRLSLAANRVRVWRGRRAEIPDLSHRRDEIGDPSVAFREMTNALYTRLDAIEGFAADVAHEIKNPLTSIQSAVESLPLAKDEAQRSKLMALIVHDISRLNRLISDISNASRVDAEMGRAMTEAVDLVALLETATEIHRMRHDRHEVRIELVVDAPGSMVMEGIPGRLGQVIDNLLSNALSFSPAGSTITVTLSRHGRDALLWVDDEGIGIPMGSEEKVFSRFYSQRPKEEAFGEHSGLGLSIVRQIVEAHGGTIHAENRGTQPGGIVGARFVVRLPLSS